MPPEGAGLLADIKRPGDVTLPIIRELVDDVVEVTEEEIARGIYHCVQNARLVVEGAGAAGVAALLAKKIEVKSDDNVCAVLCGGNIDARMLAVVLNREMVRERRLIVYRILGDDRPGMLSAMAAVIGGKGGNIIDVVHNRLALDVPAKGAEFDIMVETRDSAHADEIGQALKDKGYALRMG